MENLKKIVIIYHDQCRDGFGAAYAAWKKFGDDASYIPRKTQDPVPEGLENKEIYIVDYSYKKPDLERLREDNKSVVVIDHHSLYNDIESARLLLLKPQLLWDDKDPAAYASSKLVYDLVQRVVDVSDLAWIACIGIIGDCAGDRWVAGYC